MTKPSLKLPAIECATVPALTGSMYPKPFGDVVAGRSKQVLGNAVGLRKFGINLVRLPPGAWSSQRHWHTHEDEFIYVLEGEVVLVTDAGEQILSAGTAAGFPAGKPDGHHLINRSDQTAVYLEVGDRAEEDEVFYSDIDMELRVIGEQSVFVHKSGQRY